MEKKKCLYCAEPIGLDRRADSKFCSNTCKAKHHERKREQSLGSSVPAKLSKPKLENPLEGLKGVLDSKGQLTDSSGAHVQSSRKAVPDCVQTTLKIETEEYKAALKNTVIAEDYLNRIDKAIRSCHEQIQALENEDQKLLFREKPRNKWYEPSNVDIDDLLTWEEFRPIESDINKKENGKNHEKIRELKQAKSELERMKVETEDKLLKKMDRLKTIPQFESVNQNPVQLMNLIEGVRQNKLRDEDQVNGFETNQTGMNQPESITEVESTPYLITSKELKEMDYKCFDFKGRWKDFFGNPAIIFHASVHGKPGEGKSTFCMQFADYLAENFGNAVYISGEEGFSKTLQQKAEFLNLKSKNLFFSDLKNHNDIIQKLDNKFPFIFIDSLNTMHIDPVKLKELREQRPNSSFITISQSTKDGKMRGSNEIAHDADVVIVVDNKEAVTTKNRFKEKGMRFKVFQK